MDGCVHGDFTRGFARILAETPRLRKPLAITLLAPAWGAEVVSSNIVGYNKITLQVGYNLLGNNWNLVGGQDGFVTDVLDASGLSGLDSQGNFTSQIQLWEGDGYAIYGWAGDVGDAAYDFKWLDTGTLDPVNIPAPKGTAYWIKTGTSSEVVASGEVASEEKISTQVVAGYNLLANPFPETISIQQIQSEDLSGLDSQGNFTSQLQLWEGDGYAIYGWAGDVGDAAYDYKWLDTGTLDPATDVNLDIGKGFWIKTGSTANIDFTK